MNLYRAVVSSGGVRWMSENQRLVVFDNQELRPWHVSPRVWPNERLAEADRRRGGYFQPHEGAWVLVNEGMPRLHDLTGKEDVPVGWSPRARLSLPPRHPKIRNLIPSPRPFLQVHPRLQSVSRVQGQVNDL